MSSSTTFPELLARIRAGDEAALTQFVREYEPQIRREIRIRGTGQAVQRVVDSEDIWQLVAFRFLQRAREGHYELQTPEQLVALLVRMAFNRRLKLIRDHQAQCRDIRRIITGESDLLERPEVAPEPVSDRAVETEKILQRLSPEMRQVAHWKAEDRTWEEIGQFLNTTAEAARKRWSRELALALQGG